MEIQLTPEKSLELARECLQELENRFNFIQNTPYGPGKAILLERLVNLYWDARNLMLNAGLSKTFKGIRDKVYEITPNHYLGEEFALWCAQFFSDEKKARGTLEKIFEKLMKLQPKVQNSRTYNSQIKYIVGACLRLRENSYKALQIVSERLTRYGDNVQSGWSYDVYEEIRETVPNLEEFKSITIKHMSPRKIPREKSIASANGQRRARSAINSKRGQIDLEGFVESMDYETD